MDYVFSLLLDFECFLKNYLAEIINYRYIKSTSSLVKIEISLLSSFQ